MSAPRWWPQPGLWPTILSLLLLGGLYAIYLRATYGPGAVTGLSDTFPWGVLTGLNILGGLSLTFGGLAVGAGTRLMSDRTYQPVLRAALLIAFLSYSLTIPALLFDTGIPNASVLFGAWKSGSVLHGAAWVLAIYAVVLLLEFLPISTEPRRRWETGVWRLRAATLLLLFSVVVASWQLTVVAKPLVLATAVASPLWHSVFLPVLMMVSSLWGCVALVLFATLRLQKALGKECEARVVAALGRGLGILLWFYLGLRVLDLLWRGHLSLLLQINEAQALLGLELCLLGLPALLLLRFRSAEDTARLYSAAALALAGFLANSLNVTITSLEAGTGVRYFPRTPELLFAYALVAAGIALFYLGARHGSVLMADGAAH